MLASFPASMVNQNRSDLGILNRFNLTPSRSRDQLLCNARLVCRRHMKGSIALVNVVLDPVEKIFLRSLPNCAAGSAFFCQVWRSIKQPDGGLAVTGDDDFHKC